MNKLLNEIASWRIVSEFMRRYPDKFTIIETHPGGGTYDCLTILSKIDHKHIADLNRNGSIHIFGDNGEQSIHYDIWDKINRTEDMKIILDEISEHLRMAVPKKLPASTPEVLVYRFIAAFMSHTAFSLEKWECRNGVFDTSAFYSTIGISKDFEPFPGALDRLRIKTKDDVLNKPAYRFWFLKKDGIPRICLETTGYVWTNDNKYFDIKTLYNKEKRIWPAVWSIAGRFFT